MVGAGVPAWGYATVAESRHDALVVGEEIYGFLPMAAHVVMAPSDVTKLGFSDHFAHRAQLHPWYNRYYRTATDPVSAAGYRDLQPVLWALFMTGWMLATEFSDHSDFGADHIVVASASSKTAFSFAHSLRSRGTKATIVGLTSAMNREFVVGLGCYDDVMTYDHLDLEPFMGKAALVDMSGNAAVVRTVHEAFGDR